MEKQSMVSGGKRLALAGSAVAVVLVLLGLAFSGRLAPPDAPQGAEQASAPQGAEQASAPPTATPDAPAAQSGSAPKATAVEGTAPSDAQTAAQDQAQPETQPDASAQVTDPGSTAPATTEAATVAPETAAEAEANAQAAAPAPETATATDQTDTGAAAALDPSTDTATQTPATAESPAPSATEERDRATTLRPSFDTVRLAPDGEAVVAGKAVAGSTVEILLDGVVVGTAMTAGDGAFAAFLSLPPSDAPRVLTLSINRDGGSVASDQQVIIAPVQRADVAQASADTTSGTATAPAATAEQSVATQGGTAPAVLLSDTTGLRVLQPATPADPARIGGIALDVISYTSDGDVLLQGRATAAANILIYLDNAPVTSASVGADGIWSTGLPGVSPGIYTLRLDEVDTAGKVLSRIETPFKREDRDEVAAIAAATAPPATSEATATQTAGAGVATQTASTPTAAAPQATATDAAGSSTVRVVTVQPGNTLWAIARESYGEGPLFVRVFEANRDRIRDPDLIYPGQIFEIPE